MKYYLTLPAALCAAMLIGCAADPAGKTESANTAATVNLEASGLDFAVADAARAARRKNAVPPVKEEATASKEAIAYNKELTKKIDEARNMIWRKEYDQAEKLLKTYLKDPKAFKSTISRIPGMLVDSQIRQRKDEAAEKMADELLKSETWLSSSARASIMFQKGAVQDTLKKYDERVATLFARLSEDITENDAFQTKRQIINTLARAGKKDLAIRSAEALASDSNLPDNVKAEAAAIVVDVCRDAYEIEKTLAAQKRYAELEKNADKVALLAMRSADVFYNLKKRDLATEIRLEVLKNEKLSAYTRIHAFQRYCGPIREGKDRAARRNVVKIANETVFRIPELKSNDYANLMIYMMDTAYRFIGDKEMAKQYAASLLKYPGVDTNSKIAASKMLSNVACESGNFAEAMKTMQACYAYDGVGVNQQLDIARQISLIGTWQENCDETVKFLRSKVNDKNKKDMVAVIANTCIAFRRYDAASAIYAEYGFPVAAARVYAQIDPDKTKAMTKAIIANTKLTEQERAPLMLAFLDGSEESKAMRKTYSALMPYLCGGYEIVNALRKAKTAGDNALVIELFGYIRSNPNFEWNNEYAMIMMETYATVGNFKAVKEIGDLTIRNINHGDQRFKGDFSVRRKFCGDLLATVKDEKGAFVKFYNAYAFPADLTAKMRADLLLKAGNMAFLAGKYNLAQDAHNVYLSLFKPEPKKTYTLKYSDTPINGMQGFFDLKSQPEIQLMNRKYGGNMDFLVTDVATGDRGTAINSADGKAAYRPTEMQMACDVNGVHMLFTAYDDQAKSIEASLAGAGSYEMYFAPGENQPYICILPDMSTGLGGIWESTYNTAQWRQIDAGTKKLDLRMDHKFTKDGYQFYMYISWEKFYDKLPEAGYCWDFENIHWSRFGGNSWNGIKTIHGRSTWGALAFDINADQMRQIKRKIIFAARNAYLKEKKTNGRYHGSVDRWQKDDVLGDPKFFAEYVAPVTDKLDELMKLVSADMDAATIDKLYKEAVPGWFEIKYIISDLRRRYLEDTLSK